jgi:hypothetical protein
MRPRAAPRAPPARACPPARAARAARAHAPRGAAVRATPRLFCPVRPFRPAAAAQVKMCVDTDTGNVFAIKIFKKSLLKRRQSRFKGTAFDDVLREIAIMRKVGRRPGARTLEPSR